MECDNSHIESLDWVEDIFSAIDVGVVVIGLDYGICLWNSFMVNHSGIQSADILNKNLFQSFPNIHEKWLKKKIESVFLLNTRSFVSWEQRPYIFKFKSYRPITGSANYMYQNVTLIPLQSGNGEVNHVGMIVYDVTDIAVSQKELESANHMLGQLSRTDQLSQLYNRGYWEECLQLEYERYQRTQSPITLVMLDIDHFKAINDTYGHQAGDAVIRHAADTLQNTIRSTDIAGRYGGEEFSVILINTDSQTARYFAERLRKKIESHCLVYEEQAVKYTISLGVAELTPEMESYHQWIDATDLALYESKNTGRNKSSIFANKAL